jgi:hypothetical protein
MWVNLSSANQYDTIFRLYDNSPDKGITIQFGTTTTIALLVWNNGATAEGDFSSYFNKWTMLTARINATHKWLYINNAPFLSAAHTGTFADFAEPLHSLIIGNDDSRSRTRAVNGYIDQTDLWGRVLTDSEVTTLYNSGSGLEYPFIPPVTNNCTYVSNNWVIPCSDTCNLTATNLMGKNITLYGAGTIRGFRNVSNYTYGLINNGCYVIN